MTGWCLGWESRFTTKNSSSCPCHRHLRDLGAFFSQLFSSNSSSQEHFKHTKYSVLFDCTATETTDRRSKQNRGFDYFI